MERQPMTKNALKEPKVDSTLFKGLSILENLASVRGGKGVTELSIELGLTKSNTFRLLQSLCALGYVKHLPDKSYAATLKAWQIGRSLVENLNLRELALPEMSQLSKHTLETVYLAVPEDCEVVYIDKMESQKAIRSWNRVGGEAPIHCVGTGKAIMAANYPNFRDKIKNRLVRYTDKTLTSITALDADIALTQRRGYAYDKGEYRERVLSFGAAITLPNGDAVAALGVSLPDINLPEGGIEHFGKLVSDAALSVSAKLAKN